MQYLFMCRSLTSAQKAAAILGRTGITAYVVKAPKHLSTNGCGYAVSVYRRAVESMELLKNSNLLRGKVFVRDENGEYSEISI